MSGDKARGLSPPEPGQEIPTSLRVTQEGSGYLGLYGILWKRARGPYGPWWAKCQRCGWEWEVRARPHWTHTKMPLRCPNRKCNTRRWSRPPFNDQVLRYAPHLTGDRMDIHQEVRP